MKIYSTTIRNFRGINSATIVFPEHAVLIGDNNTGKSTLLEAIDLALGPDRLSRRPPVGEHDFYNGRYLAETPAPAAADANEGDGAAEGVIAGQEAIVDDQSPPTAPTIEVEVTITQLSEEQQARFGGHIEWLNIATGAFYDQANPEGLDAANIEAALRVTFVGEYDPSEDDFTGKTYFTRTLNEDEVPATFSKKDKQHCGFLFLRSLRTGSRALSLEHGSLLDIVLRLKEIRPQMWEDTISTLRAYDVASDPELGISGVLDSIDKSLKKYVPREWGVRPHLKVSSLTREHLRKVITAFLATGQGGHAAPFYRQGTGTINMLVLAMLSQIAEDKQNVIFAMEEAETAIPPYAQKRIVHELRKLSAQSIFTSHSPYVLEEFGLDETVILCRSEDGVLTQAEVALPDSVKHKRYRQEFRTRFCEGLLARRVLIAEGATEATSFPAAARRLAELDPTKYSSIEALGVCVIDAGTESQIADLAGLYKGLGKRVFALCDKQSDEAKATIEAQVDHLFMHDEAGIENLILKNTTADAINRFADLLNWPPHLIQKYGGDPKSQAIDALNDFFGWAKGNWGIADFLAQCSEGEIPEWIRNTCIELKTLCDPPAAAPEPPAPPPEPEAGSDFDNLIG